MSLQTALLFGAAAGIIGIAVGYYLRLIISLGKKGSVELEIKRILSDAQEEGKRITAEAEKKSIDTLREVRAEIKEKEDKLKKTEDRLIKKEELLDKRQTDIDTEVENLKLKITEIKNIRDKADALEQDRRKELEKVANLSEEDAKKELLGVVEKKYEEDMAVRMQKFEIQGTERMEKRAQEILTTAIQRLGNAVSADIMATTVQIPNDEIKGKIIGKEGRNIKAFERITGVEVIIDDTPGSITLSSFNPVRRQIARVALESLVADGRIQPAKIEEMVEKAKTEVNKIIKEKGEAAVYECGVFNLDPRIVHILGRLHFRTSYGQNVLQHSIEMAHVAGMIAEELGANVSIAKAGALLHDIGKAVDHEVQGTHVEIGRRILQKFGAAEEIIKAMQAHHGEYPFETTESVIVQVADAISGSRPGARRDTVENYLKRLEDLEGIANSFKGVEKSYALQAGREIRVFVTPSEMTDIEAKNMAREIAVRIENELKYPGEIKVTVIRETRVIEFAR
ncbi:ribonuclease Y [Candidatus Parcubacteria bacterium]|nr:ribonuclease Y [Candidatus Parcubacteria bacterium]